LQILVQEGPEVIDPYFCYGLFIVAIEGKFGFWKRVSYYTTFKVSEDEAGPFSREKKTILMI
jgi:hypothetical protein